MRRGSFSYPLAVLLALAVTSVAWSTAWLENHPVPGQDGRLLYLPNGRFLKAVALGHQTFLADILYIWSIQYYGSYVEGDRYELLEHIYSTVIPQLDPRFIDPYLIGSLIMILENRDLEMGLRLLDQGMEANPDEWILPYEAGFYCYDIGRDYRRAQAYFQKAMIIPGAPKSTRRLYAEIFNKTGDKRTSLRLWMDVLEQALDEKDEKVIATARNHVHDLRIDTDLQTLEKAIQVYMGAQGGLPHSLDELVRTGILPAVPRDPDDRPYAYDPSTGQVTPATPFVLRRR